MNRFLGVFVCLMLSLTAIMPASEAGASATANVIESALLQEETLASPLLAMNMMKPDIVCPEGTDLTRITARSETFECCSTRRRVGVALDLVKEVVFKISAICREDGCEYSAIARICVDYEYVTDEKCVAVVTAWYACCCCIVKGSVLDDCKFDEKLCSGNTVRKETKGRKYECCDVTDRWNNIYGTAIDAFDEARAFCALLECATPMGVRGFQIDFSLVDEADGICAVESTIFYSCCCPCP